ncbi:CDP-glycerol glycerophosphotransferase family protein [Staphylococcus xylosus]
MINKITSMFRRGFELYKISVGNQYLNMEFKLKNFIKFNNKNFSVKNKNQNVPFYYEKVSKNIFSVKINLNHITNEAITFDFYYKNQMLWLVADKNIDTILEVNNKIYIIRVDKTLILTQYKTNFDLAQNNKEIHIQQIEDECVSFNTNVMIEYLVLLNRNKQIEIPILNNQLNLSSISQNTKEQNYRAYIVINKTIYRTQFIQLQKINYLFMKYEWLNNTLNISMNSLYVSQFDMNSILNETSIRIRAVIEGMERDDRFKFESLGLIDEDLNNLEYLSTKRYKTKIFSKIEVSSFENMKKKKLIAIYHDKLSDIKKTYILNSKNKLIFTEYYNSKEQMYQINIKKGNGITIVSSKPKIKMGVNSVTQEKFNIYFQPNAIYETFQYYITFEERSSKNKYEKEIYRGEQDIEIPYKALEKLKTTSKNIIDIFVSIYDDTSLIRKEKIKFKKGVYKKDNYITLKEKNLDNKRVYYMLTLTPFKNIKIESFELTSEQYEILKNGKKDNNIWLIGERTDTAQDNGIQFFKWLQKHTKIEAYYVIDSESGDYNRIKHLNNIVIFGSKKHFEVSAKANVLISTHDLENILPYKTARNFWDYEKSMRVFLQHGVLGRKKVEYDKKNYDLPFHLFNVSSTREKYDIVLNQLGYAPEEVVVTGLSRFDCLPLEPKNKVKKILIMPTWRDWLNSDYAFNKSEYMDQYLKLINNQKINDLIDKYDIEINFYPHYRAQKFFENHLDKAKGRIQYISLGQRTVQELLIEHDILITDYSSVSFDFSYMQKPVIFFHFDVDQFFKKGILRPVEETFVGAIAYNENEILAKIENIITTNELQWNTDLSNIFDFVDHRNSERVYHEILNRMRVLNNRRN